MATLAEIRQKYPQYDRLSDDQLAGALHQKFYRDMPEAEFRAKIGLTVPDQRIAGAFEAAQPVRQVEKLVEPRSGLVTSRNRLGDVSFGGALGDIGNAFSTVGGIKRGEIPAMVPDTGQGVTNPQVESAAKTLGAAALPINPAVRAGDLAIAGVTRAPLRKQTPPVPTRQELYKAGDTGYNQARRMGVDYDPNFIADLAAQTQLALDRDGFRARTAPNTFNVLRDLQRVPKTGPGERSVVELEDLHTARKTLRRIPKGPDHDQDREAARRVIEAVDRFSEEPPAEGVLAGPAAAAGAIQKEARGNWAAMERSKEVAGRQQSAERRAKASNSGFNIDNTLRQRVASLLDEVDKGRIKGFSSEEIKAMNEFAVGTPTRNSVRLVANILGGGGGMATLLAGGIAGAAGGYPAAVALPALGIGAKVTQNALGRRAMTKLDETVRSRSPLYHERLAAAPIKPLPQTAPAIGTRMTMVTGQSGLPGALGPSNPLQTYLSGDDPRFTSLASSLRLFSSGSVGLVVGRRRRLCKTPAIPRYLRNASGWPFRSHDRRRLAAGRIEFSGKSICNGRVVAMAQDDLSAAAAVCHLLGMTEFSSGAMTSFDKPLLHAVKALLAGIGSFK